MSEEDLVMLVMELRSAYQMARSAEDRRTAAETEARIAGQDARAAWDEVYRLQTRLLGPGERIATNWIGQ